MTQDVSQVAGRSHKARTAGIIRCVASYQAVRQLVSPLEGFDCFGRPVEIDLAIFAEDTAFTPDDHDEVVLARIVIWARFLEGSSFLCDFQCLVQVAAKAQRVR